MKGNEVMAARLGIYSINPTTLVEKKLLTIILKNNQAEFIKESPAADTLAINLELGIYDAQAKKKVYPEEGKRFMELVPRNFANSTYMNVKEE